MGAGVDPGRPRRPQELAHPVDASARSVLQPNLGSPGGREAAARTPRAGAPGAGCFGGRDVRPGCGGPAQTCCRRARTPG